MKLAIMQPYLFPYIGYFQLLDYVDKFIIHDDVQWIKGGWINRNRILLNSEAEMITLSVKKRSNFDMINQFEIVPEQNRIKFLRKIKGAYAKSPYFNKVAGLLGKIILNKESNIVKYIMFSFEQIKNYLSIDTPILLSSKLRKDNKLKGQERVIDICRLMKTTTYINPIGGLTLYNKEKFNQCNINLFFLKTKNITYNQSDEEFIPNLSIMDVIMFNKPSEVKRMLKEFEII